MDAFGIWSVYELANAFGLRVWFSSDSTWRPSRTCAWGPLRYSETSFEKYKVSSAKN